MGSMFFFGGGGSKLKNNAIDPKKEDVNKPREQIWSRIRPCFHNVFFLFTPIPPPPVCDHVVYLQANP